MSDNFCQIFIARKAVRGTLLKSVNGNCELLHHQFAVEGFLSGQYKLVKALWKIFGTYHCPAPGYMIGQAYYFP